MGTRIVSLTAGSQSGTDSDGSDREKRKEWQGYLGPELSNPGLQSQI
jgi:hypothetical protein